MLYIDKILGHKNSDEFSETIHRLSHLNQIEYLTVSPEEISRKRLRLKSNKGTDCAIAIDREEQLVDGAILTLSKNRAIVVKVNVRKWLILKVDNIEASLSLGYFIGNLHWKVEFQGETIAVALEGPKDTYLKRLENFIFSENIEVIDSGND